MKSFKRWQYHLLWISIFLISYTGILLFIIKYFYPPLNEYSIIHHPWEQFILKAHIIVSSVSVFAFGYVFAIHAIPYIIQKVQKAVKSGMVIFVLVVPMILSGYFIQVIVHEWSLWIVTWIHIITGIIFMLVFILHQFRVNPEKKWKHISICIFFVLIIWMVLLSKGSAEKSTSGYRQNKGGGVKNINLKRNAIPFYSVEREWGIMGTRLNIRLIFLDKNKKYEKKTDRILENCWKAIHAVDLKMSHYSLKSELSMINMNAAHKRQMISKDMADIMDLSFRIHKESQHTFDIALGGLSNLWGFTQDKISLPSKNEISEWIRHASIQYVDFDRNQRSIFFKNEFINIDLGGIAKGFALDKAIETLKQTNVHCAFLDLGRQVYFYRNHDHCPDMIYGIRHPRKDDIIARANLDRSGSLATSGDYEKFFIYKNTRYPHIMDPRSGSPYQGETTSVTVFHPSAAIADAWSTALFLMDPSKEHSILSQYKEMGVIRISKEKNIIEAGFLKKIFDPIYSYFKLDQGSVKISVHGPIKEALEID